MNYLSQTIVKRCNVEPPILLGCSLPEIYATTGLSFLLILPLAIGVSVLIGNLVIGLPILMFGTLFATFLCLHQLRKLKRNRPDHYHVQWLKVKIDQLLNRGNFIQRSGVWRLCSRLQEQLRDMMRANDKKLSNDKAYFKRR